ncbi:MAG: hypothetical protein U1E22_05460 [Coriobacteriia bacterium]|nr:hypothetical protein [Coriobacteriia bacterium]
MDPLNVTIVLLLFLGVAFIEWADRRNLVATWLDRARVRYGRRVPVGWHRIKGEVGIHFGQADTILILTLPLETPDAKQPTKYVGATDDSTKFSVNHENASPDALLEAYDDSIGPLEILVSEPGRIAEIGIAADACRALPAEGKKR